MIVNLHDGPWQCDNPNCLRLFTRRVERCDQCGRSVSHNHNVSVAWGDDVTAICQGLVAIQGDGKRDQEKTLQDLQQEADVKAQAMLDTMARDQDRARAQAKPCQPDPFPMLQASVLSAVLESWAARCGGQGPVSLESHLAAVRCRVDELAGITAIIARAMLKLSRDG